jgi:hypothetical protein
MSFPRLRTLDAVPIDYQGQQMVCLTDPEGIVEERAVLSPPAFLIACLLDGERGVEEVRAAFAEHANGQSPEAEDILRVVEHLDGNGFLLSPRFEAIRQAAVQAFRERPARPAALAGMSYPAEPDALRAFLSEQFTRKGGPGELPGPPTGSPGTTKLRGLVAPHIDFERGGHAYAHSYLRLAQGAAPETVFLFGVAHASPLVPFILTRKDFETPLGTVQTDRDAVDRLADACAWDPFEDELVHRTEHSLEFQAVMLAHLYGPSVRIVPVLCGAFISEGGIAPDAEALTEVDRFLGACRDLLRERDGRACVIAAADLAHVGKRFGDDYDIDDTVVARVGERDEQDLTVLTGLNAGNWYRSVMRDENARRVCGINCIYATLKSLEGIATGAEVLSYGYAHDPAGGIVSFAGVALT